MFGVVEYKFNDTEYIIFSWNQKNALALPSLPSCCQGFSWWKRSLVARCLASGE